MDTEALINCGRLLAKSMLKNLTACRSKLAQRLSRTQSRLDQLSCLLEGVVVFLFGSVYVATLSTELPHGFWELLGMEFMGILATLGSTQSTPCGHGGWCFVKHDLNRYFPRPLPSMSKGALVDSGTMQVLSVQCVRHWNWPSNSFFFK